MGSEFLDSFSAAMIVTGLAFVCLSVGYALKSQSRMMQIQAEMLHILGDLGRAQALLLTDIKNVDGANDYQTIVALDAVEDLIQGGWRDLPEGERLRLKSTLLTLLAMMNNPDLHVD
jgi:hypothetical protein